MELNLCSVPVEVNYQRKILHTRIQSSLNIHAYMFETVNTQKYAAGKLYFMITLLPFIIND